MKRLSDEQLAALQQIELHSQRIQRHVAAINRLAAQQKLDLPPLRVPTMLTLNGAIMELLFEHDLQADRLQLEGVDRLYDPGRYA